MQDSLRGYVPITEVGKLFETSRKSVERRRDKARDAGVSAVYRQFKLRTKDGEIFVEPPLDQVKQLRADGRVPEWFVSREWLDKTFGKRGSSAGSTNAGHANEERSASHGNPPQIQEAIASLKESYEARIADLKIQLEAAEKREERFDRAHERVTQLANSLNQTTQALNQTLALPGIAEATKAKLQSAVESMANEPAKKQPHKPAQKRIPSRKKKRSWLRQMFS